MGGVGVLIRFRTVAAAVAVLLVGVMVTAPAGAHVAVGRPSSGIGAAAQGVRQASDGCFTDETRDIAEVDGDRREQDLPEIDLTRWCIDVGDDGIALTAYLAAPTDPLAGEAWLAGQLAVGFEVVSFGHTLNVNLVPQGGDFVWQLFDLAHGYLICDGDASWSPSGGYRALLPTDCINIPPSVSAAAYVVLHDGTLVGGPSGSFYDDDPEVGQHAGPIGSHPGPARFPDDTAGPAGPTAGAAQQVRIDEGDPIATSIAIARTAYPQGADVLYVARVDVLADALAAAPLDGPVVLSPSCGVPPEPLRQLPGQLNVDDVVALGGTAAICDATLDAIAGGRPTGRLAGPTRLHTAVAIAQDTFRSPPSTVYVAAGATGPDAVAAGTVTDGPVLLVPGSGPLPDVVADELDRLAPDRLVVLGGPAAIDDDVVAELTGWAATMRLAGPTRIETAADIAYHLFGYGSTSGLAADSVYLARQDDLALAVAAGTFTDGPILLTQPCGTPSPAVAGELARLLPRRIVALGGADQVCDALLAEAAEIAAVPEVEVRDDVIVLTAADAPLADVTDDGTLVWSRTSTTEQLAAGDIIAVEPQPLLPSGWAAELDDVAVAATTVTVMAHDADLDQLVADGLFRFDPSDSRFAAQFRGSADFGSIGCGADDPAQCPTVKFSLGNSRVDFDLDPLFQLNVGEGYLQMGVLGTLDAAIEFSGEVTAHHTFEAPPVRLPRVPVGSLGFGPFGIVLFLAPRIELQAKVGGTAQGKLDLGFTQQAAFGFRAYRDHFTGIPYEPEAPFSVREANLAGGLLVEPQVSMAAVLAAGVGPLSSDGWLDAGGEIGVRLPTTAAAHSDEQALIGESTVELFAAVTGSLGPVDLRGELVQPFGPYRWLEIPLADLPPLPDPEPEPEPPPGSQAGWPTGKDNAPSSFYIYLGVAITAGEGLVPTWTSCNVNFCLAGDGSKVGVYFRNPYRFALFLDHDVPDAAAELRDRGMAEADIAELLAP